MAPYDTSTHLLDRANISDVCMRLVHYYDTYNNGGEAARRDRIFAETISVDYTAFGFRPPRDYKRGEWVAGVGGLLGLFKAARHIVSNVVIELRQPRSNSTRPSIVEVVTKATGTLFTEPDSVHNGGGYRLGFVRGDGGLEKELNLSGSGSR